MLQCRDTTERGTELTPSGKHLQTVQPWKESERYRPLDKLVNK